MAYRILFALLLTSFTLTLAQAQDTTYQKRYAFKRANPYADLEKGEEFYLADGMYKVWNGADFDWGFYDEEINEKLTEPMYDTITYRYLHAEKKGFYRIKENGKWGLLNDDRSVWIPSEYDHINYVSKRQQPYISIKKGDQYGVLNPKGNLVLEAEYDNILFDGYRYKVYKNQKWGMCDAKGKELIPICFDDIEDHAYVTHMRVRQGDQWAVFNWIKDAPCGMAIHYDEIEYFSKYYVVRQDKKYGLVDLDHQTILPLEYDYLSPFFLQFLNTVLVGKDQQLGLMRVNEDGSTQVEVPIEYDDIWVDETTFKIKVKKGDRIDYYYDDQTLFDLEYNDLQYYVDLDRVMVKKKGKWGMLTPEGETIIPIAYSKIHVMKDEQFMVEKNGKWGVLNNRGKELIPVIYDQFDYRPEKGFFFVYKKGKWGIVSTKKGVILPPAYEDVYTLPNRMFLVKDKGLWGVAAPGGREVVPMDYSSYKYVSKARELWLYHSNGSVRKYPLR